MFDIFFIFIFLQGQCTPAKMNLWSRRERRRERGPTHPGANESLVPQGPPPVAQDDAQRVLGGAVVGERLL